MLFRKSVRWLLLLFMCYVATVVQLSVLRKTTADVADSTARHSRSVFTKGLVPFQGVWSGRGNNHNGQHHVNLKAWREGRLYRCRNSRERQVTLPRVPDFIIGGAQKGGTTALMKLIKRHPMIIDTTSFESHFFDYDEEVRKLKDTDLRHLDNATLCHLRSLYAHKHFPVPKLIKNTTLLSFEKTPAYILDQRTPARIKAITPWAKIIFSLRNPIDRAFSHYRMLRARNQIPENETFENVLATDLKVLRLRNYSVDNHEPFPPVERVHPRRVKHLWQVKNLIYRGMYADQLRPWLEHFTVGQDLMVVQFERMLVDPHAVLDEILDFLGVPRHSYDPARLNMSYSPVVPEEDHTLIDSTRHYLFRLYEPYNQQLIEILGENWKDVWKTTHY